MMKTFLLILILLIILGCAQAPVAEQKTVSKAAPEKTTSPQATAVETEESVVVSCEDSDSGDNPNVYGKAVLTYSDGKKQNVKDYCIKQQPVFQVEIICDGLITKEKLHKCGVNLTCVDGACP